MEPPASWKKKLGKERVDVISMGEPGMAGWCTKGTTLVGLPDVEVFCGGLNSKGPDYAGIWRQGNLLHFGFQPDPSKLSAFGKGLLENSICYIARFTEDRPIGRASNSRREGWMRARSINDDLVLNRDPGKWVGSIFAPDIVEKFESLGLEKFRAWYRANRGYLVPNDERQHELDADVKALGVPFDEIRFLRSCVQKLEDESAAPKARSLLARFVADPLDPGASVADWRRWLKENEPYLFFYDGGFYRWYVDPLAKKRGVPSAELRGPARADVREMRTGLAPIHYEPGPAPRPGEARRVVFRFEIVFGR